MNTYFPTWLNALLFVAGAVDAYLLTQTGVTFSPGVTLALGAANVAIIALTAFQRTATNAVRSMRGKPTIS